MSDSEVKPVDQVLAYLHEQFPATVGHIPLRPMLEQLTRTPDTISRETLGIRTLDAKWLDPECHKGCQSLVLKDAIEKERKELLEWLRKEHKQARQEDLSGGYALERVITHIESL